MATSQKLTEHSLTCPVCLEVFTKPCTLTCQHSFCVKCVVSYTKTQPEVVKAKSVPCPFCDRLTKVPNPDRPVEEWAEQLKPGILLVGLLDSFGPESKASFCEPVNLQTTKNQKSIVSLESMVPEIRTELQTKKEHLKKTLDNEVEQLEGKKSQFTSIQQAKFPIPFDRKSTPVHTGTINCRTIDDKIRPDLNDVLCVDVNGTHTLIAIDYNNKCVKSFYNRNNQPKQSRVVLKGNPFRLVKLEDNIVAASLPYTFQIATLTVTPDLSLLSYITTSKRYYGLTVLNPTTLAAGPWPDPGIDILDRSGNVLQSISPLHNGQKIIESPNFLCTTKKDNILVSDRETKSVLCLTPQGDVVFNYSPTGDRELECPSGITVTDTGDILVVDRRGNKVIQLSESGQFVRDILTHRDGLRSPEGLHYDESGSIYVTHEDEDGDEVFTFKW